MNDIETIFKKLVCAFCRFPEDLRMTYVESPQSILIVYTAHADDVRKLIGADGQMFKALDRVLAAVASRSGKRSRLIVDEARTGTKLPPQPFVANPGWTDSRLRYLVAALCEVLYEEMPTILINRLASDTSTVLLQLEAGEAGADLGEALTRIFDSIGRAQGRKIYVEIQTEVCHNR